MKFKKLLSTGFAVAAGLMVMASGAKAQVVFQDWYSNFDSGTEMILSITDFGGDSYTLKLTTSVNNADYLGLGWKWRDDDGNLLTPELVYKPATVDPNTGDLVDDPDSDVNVVQALDPDGNEIYPTFDDQTGPLTGRGERASLLSFGLCHDPNGMLSSCGSANNFNGSGSQSTFDYIFAIGSNGANPEDFVNSIEWTVAKPTEYLAGGMYEGENAFSHIAARAQSVGGSGDDSVKGDMVLCADPSCDREFNPGPDPVPEIDGPVLMQVGFALGGLYLLLLGRRRREDELAHAA